MVGVEPFMTTLGDRRGVTEGDVFDGDILGERYLGEPIEEYLEGMVRDALTLGDALDGKEPLLTEDEGELVCDDFFVGVFIGDLWGDEISYCFLTYCSC
mmetsp:Transcript_8035/g.12003  ORF Transcript_8035/g.12003 Transcript_8035/m.12003 type:complete len:99 (+) Transcript_8035:237-533(+)